MKNIIAISIFFLIQIKGNSQQVSTISVKSVFHIASEGGWDYLSISPVQDWLYVSHGTQVNILNKNTGDSVGVILNVNGVHGIAFDVNTGKGYTTNGQLNTLTVFDIKTNRVLGHIPTGLKPDAIIYEPFSKKIICCNGKSNNLSIVDPVTDMVIDSISVGGKPETAVSDGKGHLFVNIEDKNEIVQIDVSTFKVINHWSLSPAEEPTGLAIDVNTHRLFAGCDKSLVVVNFDNGKIVARVPIGEGCDGVAFDATKKLIYTSNGEAGTMSVIHEKDASSFHLVGNIPTKKGARTITVDPQTHKVYLPTADLQPQPAGATGRPKMVPGTFQVLVLGE